MNKLIGCWGLFFSVCNWKEKIVDIYQKENYVV